MTVLFEETSERKDVTPPLDEFTETAPEKPQESVSGDDIAPYGYTPTGRIRKRPVGSRRTGPGSTSGNEKLARQAAQLLAQLNSVVCMGLMVSKMNMTAAAIAERNDAFEEQAYQALLTDKALCTTILRAGGTSSKVSLLIAYGMLGAGVAPIAYAEGKALSISRKEGGEA